METGLNYKAVVDRLVGRRDAICDTCRELIKSGNSSQSVGFLAILAHEYNTILYGYDKEEYSIKFVELVAGLGLQGVDEQQRWKRWREWLSGREA